MLSNSLPVDEMKDIKLKATTEIDLGNKLLGKFGHFMIFYFFFRGSRREICYFSIKVYNTMVDNHGDFSNLDLDMIVRDENGDILDISKTSTTQLYEHHVQATNRIKKATVCLFECFRKFNC